MTNIDDKKALDYLRQGNIFLGQNKCSITSKLAIISTGRIEKSGEYINKTPYGK